MPQPIALAAGYAPRGVGHRSGRLFEEQRFAVEDRGIHHVAAPVEIDNHGGVPWWRICRGHHCAYAALGIEAQFAEQAVQRAVGWPTRATGAMCEPGLEELARVIARQRATVAAAQVKQFADVVEGDAQAPLRVETAQSLQIRLRPLPQAESLEHTLDQIWLQRVVRYGCGLHVVTQLQQWLRQVWVRKAWRYSLSGVGHPKGSRTILKARGMLVVAVCTEEMHSLVATARGMAGGCPRESPTHKSREG